MEAGVVPPGETKGEAETLTVSVEMPETAVDALRQLAAERGWTITQALLQAIADEKFFRDQVSEGKKILLQSADGSVTIVNLP